MKNALILLLLSWVIFAAWPDFIKPEEITPGRWGYGFTTFENYAPQKFEIKVLGVEQWMFGLTANPVVMIKCYAGPKGYNMAYVGVASGMSGSPIYIYTKNGPKLIGALAYGNWFDRDPIAGIVLAQTMIEECEKEIVSSNSTQKIKSSTLLPIVFTGPFNFPEILKEEFAKRGLLINFSPRATSGSGAQIHKSKSVKLEPGSPIFAALTTGDIILGAHGTVTMVNEETGEFYGFGHPFLNTGQTSIPVSLSRVETVVSNYLSSYKIFEIDGEIIGSLTRDFTYGVKGKLGLKPEMIPVSYKLTYQNNTLPINIQVVKIPDDWTEYLISMLTAYVLYGGYYVYHLAKIDTIGYTAIKMTFQIGDSSYVIPIIIDYNLKNVGEKYYDYCNNLYRVLKYLSLNKIKLESLNLEIEYQTGKINFLTLNQAILEQPYIRPGDSVKITLNFSKINDSSSVNYQTVYLLTIPPEADTGWIEIHIFSDDSLPELDEFISDSQKLFISLNSLSNLFLFIQTECKLINNDTIICVQEDSFRIENQIWHRKKIEKKLIKKMRIFIFKKIIPPEIIKTNKTLTLEIVSPDEYARRKQEEKKKTKPRKKFWFF